MKMVVEKVFPDHVRVRFPACSVEYLFCRDGTRLCVSMYTEQPTPQMEAAARRAALKEFFKSKKGEEDSAALLGRVRHAQNLS